MREKGSIHVHVYIVCELVFEGLQFQYNIESIRSINHILDLNNTRLRETPGDTT